MPLSGLQEVYEIRHKKINKIPVIQNGVPQIHKLAVKQILIVKQPDCLVNSNNTWRTKS